MKVRNKLIAGLLAVCLAFSLAACGNNGGSDDKKSDDAAETSSEGTKDEADSGKVYKIGLVLGTGGLGDKNFNDMAYEGVLKAQEDFGIEFNYVEPESVSDFVSEHRMFAESEEYDLLIAVGSDQTESVEEIAADFPEQKISLIDAAVEADNVSAVTTKWPEQTFLCGVIAGLGTASDMDKAADGNTVGVVLAQDNDNLRKGLSGFESGVKYVNADAEVLTAIVGDFNDPGKAKEVALSMYNRGADFIQHLAGASGLGVFNAAKEADRYAFGVGSNQNEEAPDYIVATSIRNVNEIVYNEVAALCQDKWEAGIHVSGMAEEAVGYSAELSNVELPDDILEIVEEIKAKIVSGELVPCEDVDEMDAWVAENQYEQ